MCYFAYFLEVCSVLKIQTQNYGEENSYKLGSCTNKQEKYGRYTTNFEKCCQPAGTYTLECIDSYGDGWHGGYIEINGTKYCEDFTAPKPYGYSKSVEVTFN